MDTYHAVIADMELRDIPKVHTAWLRDLIAEHGFPPGETFFIHVHVPGTYQRTLPDEIKRFHLFLDDGSTGGSDVLGRQVYRPFTRE